MLVTKYKETLAMPTLHHHPQQDGCVYPGVPLTQGSVPVHRVSQSSKEGVCSSPKISLNPIFLKFYFLTFLFHHTTKPLQTSQ